MIHQVQLNPEHTLLYPKENENKEGQLHNALTIGSQIKLIVLCATSELNAKP